MRGGLSRLGARHWALAGARLTGREYIMAVTGCQ